MPFVAVFLTVKVAVAFFPTLYGPEVFVGWGDGQGRSTLVKVAVTATSLFMVMVQVDVPLHRCPPGKSSPGGRRGNKGYRVCPEDRSLNTDCRRRN